MAVIAPWACILPMVCCHICNDGESTDVERHPSSSLPVAAKEFLHNNTCTGGKL